MERPDERKTMVFITHSIDEASLWGDRIAVMSARRGRVKEVLDMPFGWPRDADAVRSDPRFAEIPCTSGISFMPPSPICVRGDRLHDRDRTSARRTRRR